MAPTPRSESLTNRYRPSPRWHRRAPTAAPGTSPTSPVLSMPHPWRCEVPTMTMPDYLRFAMEPKHSEISAPTGITFDCLRDDAVAYGMREADIKHAIPQGIEIAR